MRALPFLEIIDRWHRAVLILATILIFGASLANTPAIARAPRAVPAADTTAHRDVGEPIIAIISIKSQQITVYDAIDWIYRAPVSTGVKGRETPAGIFAVVEKEKDHRSTMYDDAWMPHMQRITWNGIALHGGPLPGYAASHGCVRMPYGFAEKLFNKTRIGMRVIISPHDAVPEDFSHPALTPGKALEAPATDLATLARDAMAAVKEADDARKLAVTAAREAASATASLQKLEKLKVQAGIELASLNKSAQGENSDRGLKARAKSEEIGILLEKARADAMAKLDEATRAKENSKTAELKRASISKAASEQKLAGEPISIYVSRATQKLYLRRNTHKPAPDGGGEVFEAKIVVPVNIKDPNKPIGTHVFTAMGRNETGLRWSVVTISNSDDAKNALDRVTIPADIIGRIATASPRTSIIVSDEPLSSETNYRTEFVTVLSNQPQGGFITRKPTPNTRMAEDKSRTEDGFFLFRGNGRLQTDPSGLPGTYRARPGLGVSERERAW